MAASTARLALSRKSAWTSSDLDALFSNGLMPFGRSLSFEASRHALGRRSGPGWHNMLSNDVHVRVCVGGLGCRNALANEREAIATSMKRAGRLRKLGNAMPMRPTTCPCSINCAGISSAVPPLVPRISIDGCVVVPPRVYVCLMRSASSNLNLAENRKSPTHAQLPPSL